MISFEEFQKLSATYNVIPLVKTLLADLHTPVSTYLALREPGKASFLFESVEQDEKIGRFSFVGVGPQMSLRQSPTGVLAYEGGQSRRVEGSIFDALESFTSMYRQAPVVGERGGLGRGGELLPTGGLTGGFVGYLGYNAIRHIERIPIPDSELDTYDESRFDLFSGIVRFDHRRQSITIIQNVFLEPSKGLREQYESGRKAVEALELKLKRSVVGAQQFQADMGSLEEYSTREEYCQAVNRAKRYIFEGDVFQLVLSRKMRLRCSGDPFAVYRALRVINPSPYLFYIDFGHTRLVGSSPEVLVRVQDRMVELLPIAGTRPRGETEAEDRQLEQELLADEKEVAEHVMLVDLGRNDVGRISEYGTVEVPVLKRVDRYSHVMHIVSHVRGALRQELSPIDALRSSFPAGTVSGAPKVRAMELITELEGRSRGLYAGAVGYVGLNGTLDTCIAIRTMFVHGDHVTIQTGAGIVADSVPEAEYAETVSKARALFAALEAASRGSQVP
jgi:anthranilate synthase component 1